MTPLRQRMLEDLRVRNYAPKTQEIYVDHVARFARHFGRSPEELGPEEIRAYQVHLIQEKNASWSQFNQSVWALRFLYRTTSKQSWAIEQIPFPKQLKRLPSVLSPEEVATLLRAVKNQKHRLVLMTIYAAGLRVSEAVALQVTDIDSARMVIRVRQGKGRKDRLVMLSPILLEELRRYWRWYRPTLWLFPGGDPSAPLSVRAIQMVCSRARQAAGIRKRVSCHTLRHHAESGIMPSGPRITRIRAVAGNVTRHNPWLVRRAKKRPRSISPGRHSLRTRAHPGLRGSHPLSSCPVRPFGRRRSASCYAECRPVNPAILRPATCEFPTDSA